MCASTTGKLDPCDAGAEGIPAIASFATTKNTIALDSITNGVITATSGATTTTGTNLTSIQTPSNPDGAANMRWVESGTICDAKRGLKPGSGNCV